MPITATSTDIDELGHVSNLVYVKWVLDVAMAHSRALGWDHPQYRALGAVFVVRRHEVDYVAQVREGEELIAETWVDDWRLASCIRRTEIRRVDRTSATLRVAARPTGGGACDRVVARGATTWAMISLATGRPQRIPDDLRALFS